MDSTGSKLLPGHLLCGGFEGTSVTPQALHLIKEHGVSSMILSRKNAVSAAQMAQLIQDLQYVAFSEADYEFPIMFAIDEEGGMVNSLFDPENLTQCPCAMALAATGDEKLVYELLKAIAIELKYIGFLIILGPVLDVVSKFSHQLVGVRSFGSTIEDVSKYGHACAKGLQDGGLITVGKHFPGIGNANTGSLLEVPIIGDSLDQIRHVNIVPFAKLIEADVLDGISASGCGVPAISPSEGHACLSPIILTQLLRKELRFKGFVISECLEMDALHHSIGLSQGIILAISAGCDLVMVCHEKSLQDEAVESLKKAVANGNLDADIVRASMERVRALNLKAPKWNEVLPNGMRRTPMRSFPELDPKKWAYHQSLADRAYQKSITLVRNVNDLLPITKFLEIPNKGKDADNNILLLTPLLNPVYSDSKHSQVDSKLFTGEEVFQKFGEMLCDHAINKEKSYNVLHTSYTANGLTRLHESFIEKSRVVIFVTSEALRNMSQVGIVKYVSILCGANPVALNDPTAEHVELKKPLVIIACQSPYDFFYNKGIGSVYMCCYDYTTNAMEKVRDVLFGDCEPEGCIPGERKFSTKSKKRKLVDYIFLDASNTNHTNSPSRRQWLVDEFELTRDWPSLKAVWLDNSHSTEVSLVGPGQIDYQREGFSQKLYALLGSTAKEQQHFVVRNSSLNIIYGIALTWVHEDKVRKSHSSNPDDPPVERHGSIIFIMVDKSRRQQSIGRSLHHSAMRYLIEKRKCTHVTFGSSLPLVFLPDDSNWNGSSHALSAFMLGVGWTVKPTSQMRRKHIMVINNMDRWQVPKNIFRELMIVGVRFTVCKNHDQIRELIKRATSADSPGNNDDKESLMFLYAEAISQIESKSAIGLRLITALEPKAQKVIGSVILFTNKSHLAKFYPFMDECAQDTAASSDSGNSDGRTQIVGGIVGSVIDPLYSSLTQILYYGLICSGITFLKTSFVDRGEQLKQCMIAGVNDDKSIKGIEDIGFQKFKYYYDYYDQLRK